MMANPVIHFEVAGKDGPALQEFYRSVFDWTIDANNPMKYGIIASSGEGGIGGGVTASQDGSTMVTFYVQVDDLQAALDKAEAAGGKTVMPPMDIPGGPKIAMFTDPEGNTIGLTSGM